MPPQQFVGELMVSDYKFGRRDGASRGASPVLCPVQKIETPCGPELSSMGLHSVSRLAAMARGPTTTAVDNAGRSGPLGMRALLGKTRNTSVEI